MNSRSIPSFRISLLLPMVAVLALAGCGKPEQAPPTVPEVGVFTIEARPLLLDTSLPGRTTAFRVAEVRPQVSGILLKRLFEEGADIKQGQPLYQIDAATYEAQLAKVRANLQSAQQLAKRYETLRESKSISQQQYDDAQAAWRQAEADVELARINVVYTRVLAPISGRIGRSAFTEGALVTNGQAQPLATVQQIDPIYVDMTRSMAEILRLQKRFAAGELERGAADVAKVGLVLEDGSEYERSGTLKLSEIGVDPGTGSVTLRALFANPEGKLQPGMFVHATLQTALQKDAILVPQQAVTRDAKGEPLVWVVGSDGMVQPRSIQTLRTVGNAWLTSDGLQPGEQVVTEGLQRLRTGLQVKAVPAQNVSLVTQFGVAGR